MIRLTFLIFCLAGVMLSADSLPPLKGKVPQNVAELWKDYDPRKELLKSEVVREWEEDGNVIRYVRYFIGTFKGKPAWMAGFYAYPKHAKGGKKMPGILHMHGGGQRASLLLVKFHAAQGYGALSVNWGGRPMEGAKPGEANTDWGAVDPTQNNVPGYFNVLPGEKFLDSIQSPRNCNWFLLTLGCRRGLTFLEQQSEVDGKRLGIRGHSMGGNIASRYASIYPENVKKLVNIEGILPNKDETEVCDTMSYRQKMRDWVKVRHGMSSRLPRRYANLHDAFERMHEENPHLTEAQARHLTCHGASQNEDGTYSWKFDNYTDRKSVV